MEIEFWRQGYNIDLPNENALEWLAFYSSEIWAYECNNTILIDMNWNIYWYKYNGVKLTSWKECKVVIIKNNHIKTQEWFYIIDINKKGYFIEWNYKINRGSLNSFFETFTNFILWKINDEELKRLMILYSKKC